MTRGKGAGPGVCFRERKKGKKTIAIHSAAKKERGEKKGMVETPHIIATKGGKTGKGKKKKRKSEKLMGTATGKGGGGGKKKKRGKILPSFGREKTLILPLRFPAKKTTTGEEKKKKKGGKCCSRRTFPEADPYST